jgi:hypothetical protein
MVYFDFLKKTNKYLKSVRIIKDYVSIDMIFPKRWSGINYNRELVEIIDNGEKENYKQLSFVCLLNDKEKVDYMEKCIDIIIKNNLEIEEKESLFQNKVKELKTIFENQKLSELKNLKFDIDKITSILNDDEQDTDRVTEGDGITEQTEEIKQD